MVADFAPTISAPLAVFDAGGAPPAEGPEVAQGGAPRLLYITLTADLAAKIGTCQRCVVQEQGRPARAWDAEGDRDLDFDRERLLAELAEFGVFLTERRAYVCP